MEDLIPGGKCGAEIVALPDSENRPENAQLDEHGEASDVSEDDDSTDSEDSENEEEEIDISKLAEKSKLVSAAIIDSPRMLNKALRRSARKRQDSDKEKEYIDIALRFAVEARHIECARILIRHGANVNQENEGVSLLRYAIQQEHHTVVSCLLSSGRCWLSEADNGGDTPLHLAVHLGDLQSVEMLIKAGADINALNGTIETPLIIAAQLGYDDIVKKLLREGCDVTVCKFSRRTAFHRAVECGNLNCVKSFLDHGINPHLKDSDGWSGLHMAANHGHEKIVKTLLSVGCSANVTDNEGRTPLFESCTRGHIETTKTLIAAGSRTHVQNDWGNTPLTEAATMGHADIVRLLLRCACQVDTAGYRKMTALHCACIQGYPNCVSALLEGGADPNAVASKGGTPLHLMIKNKLPTLPVRLSNQVAVFRSLLAYNCHLEARCQVTFGVNSIKKTVTAFELAVSLGQFQIACWLEYCGASTRIVHQLINDSKWTPGKQMKDETVMYLFQRALKVRSLMEICRNVIRKSLGRNISANSRKLEMPRSLVGFITFQHLEHEVRHVLPKDCQI